MENLQEKIENTKIVLSENIIESVTEFQTTTNSDITLEQLYSLCEEATALLLEADLKDNKPSKKKKPKPAGRTPGSLKSGPSDRPWRSGKLVRFRALRAANKGKLKESVTELDVNACADQMVEILISEGVLDTIQSVGDVASAIPGPIGGIIGGVNTALTGARAVKASLQNNPSEADRLTKLSMLRGIGIYAPGGALASRGLAGMAKTSGIGRLLSNPAAGARLAGRVVRKMDLGQTAQRIGQQFRAGMQTSTPTPVRPPQTAIMPVRENAIPDYIKVGIAQPFGVNKTNPQELDTIMNIVNEGKTKVKKKSNKPAVGEDDISGIQVSRPILIGSQGIGAVQAGEGSVIDPLAMRGIYGTSLGPIRENSVLKEYVKNPIANKEKKQKFKIVFSEGGKKLEAFAGSERGVKRAVYGKKNYRVYTASGSDVTKSFKK